MKVALLTGGKDPHYARGLLRELIARGVDVDLVCGDELMETPAPGPGRVEYHNLVGAQSPGDRLIGKTWRVLSYYVRLGVFAARTDARLFHILWFRKFPTVERMLVTAYLKALGKRIVFTAHNVDDRARDGVGTVAIERASLGILYRIVDHVLVHTEQMRAELIAKFGVPGAKVTVVPFGLNDVIPVSRLTRADARRHLGLDSDEKVLLFFGNIAPYKGVEDLVRALADLAHTDDRFTLILAGRVKDRSCKPYWDDIEALIEDLGVSKHVRKAVHYIPDEEVGLLFRASDVTILPYRRVYLSGVLALSYAQGLPVIASDVGSLAADVVDGQTGFVFEAGDVAGLVKRIRDYFSSELYHERERRSRKIERYGAERFSWEINADRTCAVYRSEVHA